MCIQMALGVEWCPMLQRKANKSLPIWLRGKCLLTLILEISFTLHRRFTIYSKAENFFLNDSLNSTESYYSRWVTTILRSPRVWHQWFRCSWKPREKRKYRLRKQNKWVTWLPCSLQSVLTNSLSVEMILLLQCFANIRDTLTTYLVSWLWEPSRKD